MALGRGRRQSRALARLSRLFQSSRARRAGKRREFVRRGGCEPTGCRDSGQRETLAAIRAPSARELLRCGGAVLRVKFRAMSFPPPGASDAMRTISYVDLRVPYANMVPE